MTDLASRIAPSYWSANVVFVIDVAEVEREQAQYSISLRRDRNWIQWRDARSWKSFGLVIAFELKLFHISEKQEEQLDTKKKLLKEADRLNEEAEEKVRGSVPSTNSICRAHKAKHQLYQQFLKIQVREWMYAESSMKMGYVMTTCLQILCLVKLLLRKKKASLSECKAYLACEADVNGCAGDCSTIVPAAPSSASPVTSAPVLVASPAPVAASPVTPSPVESTQAPVTIVPVTTSPVTPAPVESTISPVTQWHAYYVPEDRLYIFQNNRCNHHLPLELEFDLDVILSMLKTSESKSIHSLYQDSQRSTGQ